MKRTLFAACLWAAAVLMIYGLSHGRAHAQNGVAPNPDLLFACNKYSWYDGTASGNIKMVTGNANSQIYVCGFTFWADGTVAISLQYGTGGNCGTGTQVFSPAFQFTAQTGIVDHPVVYQGFAPVPPSNDLCIFTSSGAGIQAIVYFAQF